MQEFYYTAAGKANDVPSYGRVKADSRIAAEAAIKKVYGTVGVSIKLISSKEFETGIEGLDKKQIHAIG